MLDAMLTLFLPFLLFVGVVAGTGWALNTLADINNRWSMPLAWCFLCILFHPIPVAMTHLGHRLFGLVGAIALILISLWLLFMLITRAIEYSKRSTHAEYFAIGISTVSFVCFMSLCMELHYVAGGTLAWFRWLLGHF